MSSKLFRITTSFLCRFLVLIVSLAFISLSVSAIAGAADDKVIKVGISGPMKFPAGEHSWIGAEMAAEEINARGGVLVNRELYKIELVKADSNEYLSIPDAVSALERLITVNKVNFIFGGARSEAILAQQELMAENKIIYIMSGGGSPKLCSQIAQDYDKFKYFFRTTTPNSFHQVQAVSAILDLCASEIRNQLGIEKPKVALLMEKAVWADAMVAFGESTLPKLGMEVVGVWRPSPKASDMTAELSAIKASGAQIIFHVFSGPAGVIFGKQWGELKIPAACAGVNIESQLQKYWRATAGNCEYEVIMNPVIRAAVTGKTIEFYDKYVEKTGDYPVYTGAGGYDAIYFLKDAVERAGTLESDAVVAALEETDYLGVAGRIQFYPKNHKTPHDLKFGPRFSTAFGQQWSDGDLVPIWPAGKDPLAVIGAGPGWEGVRFEGTVDYELPPFMVEYWKGKAQSK